MQFISHYASPLGNILLASNTVCLTGAWFEGQKYFACSLDPVQEETELPIFDETRRWLEVYFSGRDPGSPPPLQLTGTSFQKAVWEILTTIPYGQTRTYGEIARLLAIRRGVLRISAQAVGGAVGRNPISILVPCHRVVGAKGTLTGYAGGIEKKSALLRLEQVNAEDFFLPQRDTAL